MDPPGEMIDVGGRRLHLLRRGQGVPTVILEAGGGGGSSTQDWPLLNRVARFAHVLSYDRAGLGWSDPATVPKTINGIAGDLDALLASADEPPPYVLVGGSFGGLLVRAFCRLFPARVAGAVFLDAPDEVKYYPTMQRMLPVRLSFGTRTGRSGAPGYSATTTTRKAQFRSYSRCSNSCACTA